MQKIFEELPENLELAIEQGFIPWGEPVREDFLVVVFNFIVDHSDSEEPSLIFAAKYPTISILGDCLHDAIAEGQRMIAAGECKTFYVNYSSNSKLFKWPHIELTWSN